MDSLANSMPRWLAAIRMVAIPLAVLLPFSCMHAGAQTPQGRSSHAAPRSIALNQGSQPCDDDPPPTDNPPDKAPPDKAQPDDELTADEPLRVAGLKFSFRDSEGRVSTGTCARVDAEEILGLFPGRTPERIEWSGFLQPPREGRTAIGACASGSFRIQIDDSDWLSHPPAAANEKNTTRPARASWISSPAQFLTYERHKFFAEYHPAREAPQFLLFWSLDDSAPESIAASHFEQPPRIARGRADASQKTPRHPSDKQQQPENDAAYQRGRTLSQALRCNACHSPQPSSILPGPSLDRASAWLDRQWLVKRLTESPPLANDRGPDRPNESADAEQKYLARRMPHFQIAPEDAEAIAAYVLAERTVPDSAQPKPDPPKATVAPQAGDPQAGESLFVSLGCLACHSWRSIGEPTLFDGGDLTRVAEKRPANFFEIWLADPASLNFDHRMPVFEMTAVERADLAAFLSVQRGDPKPNAEQKALDRRTTNQLHDRGRELFAAHQCNACHAISDPPQQKNIAALRAESDWDRACVSPTRPAANQPRYDLTAADRMAIQTYVRQASQSSEKSNRGPATAPDHNPIKSPLPAEAQDLLEVSNCTACHARDTQTGLLPRLVSLSELRPALRDRLSSLTPPSLVGVGDKLTDSALHAAIARTGPVHRPYLQIRMPKYRMKEHQIDALRDDFIRVDRVPEVVPDPMRERRKRDDAHQELASAGPRLVT
ncbi:MAG: hypothetical protein RIS70_3104, partial [Planctomycetota bacterium]